MPFVYQGRMFGGRPLFGISGVRPSAVEQSASQNAWPQHGEATCVRTIHRLTHLVSLLSLLKC